MLNNNVKLNCKTEVSLRTGTEQGFDAQIGGKYTREHAGYGEFGDDSEQEMGRFVQANRRGEGVNESSRIRYFYVSKRTSFQNVPFL